jgi:hypothetical protein
MLFIIVRKYLPLNQYTLQFPFNACLEVKVFGALYQGCVNLKHQMAVLTLVYKNTEICSGKHFLAAQKEVL